MAAIEVKKAPVVRDIDLKLSEEMERDCKVIYRKKDDGYYFYDIWNGNNQSYDDNCVVLPVRSTYKGIIELDTTHEVVNVEGSSEDPNPYGNSWIGVMRLVYDINGYKSSLLDTCAVSDTQGHGVHPTIVGGHVRVLLISKEPICLIPLCSRHNNYTKTYPMRIGRKIPAIELNYMFSLKDIII